MNIKAVIKYELYDMKKALVIFYGIIYVLLTFLSLFPRVRNTEFISGMELASIIFIFVAGLNSFKRCFEFYQANGVSRKEQHFGFMINVWVVAAGMSLIDNIKAFVFSNIVPYHSVFYQIYGSNRAVTRGAFDISYYLESFLWALFVYALFFTIGYSISMLYYKMNKTWKITVSVGFPVLLFGLSVIDDWFNHATIGFKIIDFVPISLGVAQNDHNPYLAVITTGLVTIIFTLINHAMIRRTALK